MIWWALGGLLLGLTIGPAWADYRFRRRWAPVLRLPAPDPITAIVPTRAEINAQRLLAD